jgi:non-ribosomal peptide synthase protein (TIGR01720 family)
VIGIIIGNELEFTWNYSRDIHNRETIAHIAGRFFHHLREIILHCQSPEAQGFTPSDFPGLRMSQKGLDDLLAKIK